MSYFTGTGQNLVVNSGGNDTIIGSPTGGSDTIFAGSGHELVFNNATADLFVGQGSSSTIIGGSVQTTVFGSFGGSNITLFANTATGGGIGSGAGLLLAGSGPETLNGGGSTQSLEMAGSSGNALMIDGSGDDTVFAGSGNNTIVGGSGHDLFAFVNGGSGGSDVIQNLSSSDFVVLLGYGGASAIANAVASQQVLSGGVQVTLSDSTKITFTGISHVTASNFLSF